eukprot:2675361-Prymnesium_polylepis.1
MPLGAAVPLARPPHSALNNGSITLQSGSTVQGGRDVVSTAASVSAADADGNAARSASTSAATPIEAPRAF